MQVGNDSAILQRAVTIGLKMTAGCDCCVYHLGVRVNPRRFTTVIGCRIRRISTQIRVEPRFYIVPELQAHCSFGAFLFMYRKSDFPAKFRKGEKCYVKTDTQRRQHP